MLTLAVTTTTKLASVSLHEDSMILGEIRMEVARTHSTTILDQIDRLFTWTGKRLEDVGNVVVSIGPGSFTGVRIAISVVKGMFYGRNVSYYPVNELDALAYQALYILDSFPEKKTGRKNSLDGMEIYSLIDSGKEKIYYAVYRIKEGTDRKKLEKLKDYRVSSLNEVISDINNENKEVFIIGDAVFNYRGKIEEKTVRKAGIPSEDSIKIRGTTFMKMLSDGILEKTDIFCLKPDYLEKSQAERDKK